MISDGKTPTRRTIRDIQTKALNVKGDLMRRSERIIRDVTTIAKAEAGIVHVGAGRLETMKDTLQRNKEQQWDDTLVYATLRWALGITEDIEPENMDLND